MNIQRLTSFITLIMVLASWTASGQLDSTQLSVKPYKQSIYGSLGVFPPILTAAVEFDYFLLSNRNIKLGGKSSITGIAAGDFDGGGSEGLAFGLGAVALFGRTSTSGRFVFFELNYGVLFSPEIEDTDIEEHGLIYAGIRFGKNKLFGRVGFGVPGLAQVSFGYNF